VPHVTGTLINIGTVLAGTAVGTSLGERLPERIRETVMSGLGLVVLLIGIDAGFAAFRPPLSTLTRGSVLIVLGSVLVGGIVGELLGIDPALTALGDALKRRFARGQSRFTEGFVVASLVFCVGPLTILGSLKDGLTGDYSLLAVKSMLDGFAAMAFASALGWGVGFSVVTIIIYQGGLSLLAGAASGVFDELTVAAITATGGVLILAIGLRLLDLREIRVANLFPALVLAPVVVAIYSNFR
jgi:uncharacterized membrane protein YqgA involved in biofilm formation